MHAHRLGFSIPGFSTTKPTYTISCPIQLRRHTETRINKQGARPIKKNFGQVSRNHEATHHIRQPQAIHPTPPRTKLRCEQPMTKNTRREIPAGAWLTFQTNSVFRSAEPTEYRGPSNHAISHARR